MAAFFWILHNVNILPWGERERAYLQLETSNALDVSLTKVRAEGARRIEVAGLTHPDHLAKGNAVDTKKDLQSTAGLQALNSEWRQGFVVAAAAAAAY